MAPKPAPSPDLTTIQNNIATLQSQVAALQAIIPIPGPPGPAGPPGPPGAPGPMPDTTTFRIVNTGA